MATQTEILGAITDLKQGQSFDKHELEKIGGITIDGNVLKIVTDGANCIEGPYIDGHDKNSYVWSLSHQPSPDTCEHCPWNGKMPLRSKKKPTKCPRSQAT